MPQLAMPAPAEIRSQVSKLIKTIGLPETSRRLQLSKGCIAAVVANIPVTRGTISLLREQLSSKTEGT